VMPCQRTGGNMMTRALPMTVFTGTVPDRALGLMADEDGVGVGQCSAVDHDPQVTGSRDGLLAAG
jgi:hypothetical protein